MKKLLLTFISSIIFLGFSSKLFAQEALTTAAPVASNKIETESSLGSQSVWNGNIPITVKFRTNFDSDNVEITWDAPSGISVSSSQRKFSNVVAGETYIYKGVVNPTNPGSYSVSSNVTAWQYNTNYTASSYVTLKLSDKLLVDPLPANYSAMVILKYAIFVIGGGLALYGVYLLFKKFSKVFIKWLRPPM